MLLRGVLRRACAQRSMLNAHTSRLWDRVDERRGGQSVKDRGAKRAKETTDAKEP